MFRIVQVFALYSFVLGTMEAAIPPYLPFKQAAERNVAIQHYFQLGFNGPEILSLLLNVHGFYLSLSCSDEFLKVVIVGGEGKLLASIS